MLLPSFRYFALERLLEKISHVIGIRLWYTIDTPAILSDTVKRVTGYKTAVQRFNPQGVIPLLYSVWYSVTLKTRTLQGGSCHVVSDIAEIKAQGEVLERISCYFPLAYKHLLGTKRVNAIRKKKLIGKSILGYRIKLFSYDDVYYAFPHTEQTANKDRTSSGCAGHTTYKKAILNGLLELIERDAFMVHWLNTVPPPKIVFSKKDLLTDAAIGLFERLERYKITYWVLNITSDIPVPACLAVVKVPTVTGNRYFVGGASGFNFDEMFISATCEALSVCFSHIKSPPYFIPENYAPFTDSLVGHQERKRIYFTPEMENHIQFLFSSSKISTVSEFVPSVESSASHSDWSNDQQILYLNHIFSKRYKIDTRWDVFACTIKNQLLDLYNFKVVRVLCDALYPLYLTERYADLDHPRLAEFARYKGLPTGNAYNPWPHPFP